MAYTGKIKKAVKNAKRYVKEAIGGKKTYLPKDKKLQEKLDTARYKTRKLQSRAKAAAAKEGVELKGLTKKAKERRVEKDKAEQPKGDRQYRGASGADLKELEKTFGKKR